MIAVWVFLLFSPFSGHLLSLAAVHLHFRGIWFLINYSPLFSGHLFSFSTIHLHYMDICSRCQPFSSHCLNVSSACQSTPFSGYLLCLTAVHLYSLHRPLQSTPGCRCYHEIHILGGISAVQKVLNVALHVPLLWILRFVSIITMQVNISKLWNFCHGMTSFLYNSLPFNKTII